MWAEMDHTRDNNQNHLRQIGLKLAEIGILEENSAWPPKFKMDDVPSN